jgi:hypothetical protein
MIASNHISRVEAPSHRPAAEAISRNPSTSRKLLYRLKSSDRERR